MKQLLTVRSLPTDPMVEDFPHETRISADPALVGPKANIIPYKMLEALFKKYKLKN